MNVSYSHVKMTVFWFVALCTLVEVFRRFGDEMEAASTSETSVNFQQTARRNILDDSHLLTRRRDNLKTPVCVFLVKYRLCDGPTPHPKCHKNDKVFTSSD
jgi:hypothetical protein